MIKVASLMVLLVVGIGMTPQAPNAVGRIVPDAEAAQVTGGCSGYTSDVGCGGGGECALTTGIVLDGKGDFSSKTRACGAGCTQTVLNRSCNPG